jgi:hypothetical protein
VLANGAGDVSGLGSRMGMGWQSRKLYNSKTTKSRLVGHPYVGKMNRQAATGELWPWKNQDEMSCQKVNPPFWHRIAINKLLPVVRITQLSLPVMGNKKVSELEVPKGVTLDM